MITMVSKKLIKILRKLTGLVIVAKSNLSILLLKNLTLSRFVIVYYIFGKILYNLNKCKYNEN
jgi:hypothetical protein